MTRGAALPTTLLVLALALAACGEDGEGKDEERDIFRAVPQGTIKAASDRAAPRWERVARFSGTGTTTRTVDIARGAIQWRARWRCRTGRLTVSISPPPRSGPARASDGCPGTGEHEWVTTGRRQLRVTATGRWEVEVEQEVDTALHEPPLAAMRSPAADVLARGAFYDVERESRGRAELHRLGNGRLALRMTGFATEPNTDLYVWVSAAARPRTTRAAFRSRHVQVALLKSTLGDQNYLLPRDLDERDIRSIVIWCDPVQIAYAAATLER